MKTLMTTLRSKIITITLLLLIPCVGWAIDECPEGAKLISQWDYT